MPRRTRRGHGTRAWPERALSRRPAHWGGPDLRDALDPIGFTWLTSHNFRKTAATLLDDGGLTVREIADQLGHKRVSETLDTYLGRAQPSPKVAKLLDVIDL